MVEKKVSKAMNSQRLQQRSVEYEKQIPALQAAPAARKESIKI